MKKIISVAIALTLCVALLAGCGSSAPAAPAPTTPAPAADPAPAESAPPVEEAAPTFDFPTKPIEIAIPWNAGGIVDIIVRQLAAIASEDIGQPIAIINTPGAAGTLCTTEYLQKDADGYSLLVSSLPVVCFQPYIREVEYSLDDFTGIIGLHQGKYFVLTCPSQSGLETMEDIIEKGKNGTILAGTGGVGTFDDVYGSALMNALGVSFQNVAYDDSISIQNALLNGSIDVCLGSIGNFEEQVKAGNISVLATYDAESFTLPEIGEIPSLKELGYDVSGAQQFFILGRAGTDEAIITYLYEAFLRAMDTEAFKEIAGNSNLIMNPMTPEELNAVIHNTYELAGTLLK